MPGGLYAADWMLPTDDGSPISSFLKTRASLKRFKLMDQFKQRDKMNLYSGPKSGYGPAMLNPVTPITQQTQVPLPGTGNFMNRNAVPPTSAVPPVPLETRGAPDPMEAMAKQLMDQGLSEDEIRRRIASAGSYLTAGTVASAAPVLMQSSAYDIPKQDDTFWDKSIRKTPSSIVDSQRAAIDRNTRSSQESVLDRGGPLNMVSNVVNTIANRGTEAQSALALDTAKMDIGLENDFLARKQQSLDRNNANIAVQGNEVRNNENTRLSNLGALTTNYANQRADLANNENQLLDRNRVLKSSQAMQLLQMQMLRDMMNRR